MKRLLLIVLGVVCCRMGVCAQDVTVEVRGIRNAKGSILVMAQKDEVSKPVYAMIKATERTAIVVLKDVPWEKFTLSLFHDENENMDLDKDEQGRPLEGYVREKCKKESDKPATVKVELYYPIYK